MATPTAPEQIADTTIHGLADAWDGTDGVASGTPIVIPAPSPAHTTAAVHAKRLRGMVFVVGKFAIVVGVSGIVGLIGGA